MGELFEDLLNALTITCLSKGIDDDTRLSVGHLNSSCLLSSKNSFMFCDQRNLIKFYNASYTQVDIEKVGKHYCQIKG